MAGEEGGGWCGGLVDDPDVFGRYHVVAGDDVDGAAGADGEDDLVAVLGTMLAGLLGVALLLLNVLLRHAAGSA